MLHIESQTLIRCEESAPEVIVPDGIREVAPSAFRNGRTLVHLVLPRDVRVIGDYAMRSCIKLKKLRLPETVRSFGVGMFQDCRSLLEVSLPYGVIAIDHLMFRGCVSLTELTLPDSLQGIAGNAFDTCRSLTVIRIRPDLLPLLPPAARQTAALTYMREHPNASDPAIDQYTRDHARETAAAAIRARDALALRYILRNGLLPQEDLPPLVELAASKKLTEFSAMLLSFQNPDETALPFEADPFSDPVPSAPDTGRRGS